MKLIFLRKSFTIIEFLIVIAIIVMLMSLLNPTFEKITESAQRTECLNRQKGFINTVHIMSDDRDGFLPTGGSSHARSMTVSRYNEFLEYISNQSDMICPNVNFEGKGNQAIKRNSYVMHIGYQYFGNNSRLLSRRRVNNPKRNYLIPLRVIDSPEAALVADDIGYANGGLQQGGGSWVMAPHNVYDDQTSVPNGTTPISVGAEGGNVGLLDGSARWKDIYDLSEYFNSTSSSHFGYW